MDMNSGYNGYRMSKRAAYAYECGEMPKYKWTKKAILAAVEEFCNDADLLFKAPKGTKDELFNQFIVLSSWHHTSRYCNATDFYCVNTNAVVEAFRPLTEEEKAAKQAALVAAIEESAAKRAAKLDKMEREDAFKREHGFHSNTLAAYMLVHPNNIARRTSKKGNELVEILASKDAYNAGVYEARRATVQVMRCFNAID